MRYDGFQVEAIIRMIKKLMFLILNNMDNIFGYVLSFDLVLFKN